MYDSASPYSKTYINGDYLDLMNPRYVISEDTDEYDEHLRRKFEVQAGL